MKPGRQPKKHTPQKKKKHTSTHTLAHKQSQYFTPCICQLRTIFICGENIHKSKHSSVPYTYCESVVQNTTAEDPPRWSPRISTGWFNSLKSVRSFFYSTSFLNTECKPSLRYPLFLSWDNPLCDSSHSLCMDDNSAESNETSSVSHSNLANSLRVAGPRGFPSAPLSGFWSAEESYHMLRIAHATLGVHCFHAGPEGNFISTELWVSVRPWCAHNPLQTLPWALFSPALRMHCIRWKTLDRKDNVWAVMPSPLPQICLLLLFFLIWSKIPRTSDFTFLFILEATISSPTLRKHLQKRNQSWFSTVCFVIILCFRVYKIHIYFDDVFLY